jgi:hypothetical protein
MCVRVCTVCVLGGREREKGRGLVHNGRVVYFSTYRAAK